MTTSVGFIKHFLSLTALTRHLAIMYGKGLSVDEHTECLFEFDFSHGTWPCLDPLDYGRSCFEFMGHLFQVGCTAEIFNENIVCVVVE
jgi:hypothetical protein